MKTSRTHFTTKDREEVTSKRVGKVEMYWGAKRVLATVGLATGGQRCGLGEKREIDYHVWEPAQGRRKPVTFTFEKQKGQILTTSRM